LAFSGLWKQRQHFSKWPQRTGFPNGRERNAFNLYTTDLQAKTTGGYPLRDDKEGAAVVVHGVRAVWAYISFLGSIIDSIYMFPICLINCMYICRRLSKILHGMAKVGPNMLIIILLLFGVQGNNISGGYNDVHKYCYSTGYNILFVEFEGHSLFIVSYENGVGSIPAWLVDALNPALVWPHLGTLLATKLILNFRSTNMNENF
jgi:hypothetical protein